MNGGPAYGVDFHSHQYPDSIGTLTRSRTTSVATCTTVQSNRRCQDFRISRMPSEMWTMQDADSIFQEFTGYMYHGPNASTADLAELYDFTDFVLKGLGQYNWKLFPAKTAIAIFEVIVDAFQGKKNLLQEIGVNISYLEYIILF